MFVLCIGLLLLTLPPVPPATGAPSNATTAENALAWLANHQNAAGGWHGVDPPYVVEAAAAAGRDVRAWPTPERSAWDAFHIVPCPPRQTPADQRDCDYKLLLRFVHAAGAAGYDPRDIHGIDGVALARAGFVGGQFGDPTYVNDDVWAIIALRAAGIPRDDPEIRAAVANIHSARVADGGWSHRMVATGSDTDMTAMAIVALASAGERVENDARARDVLLSRRDPEGGFANGPIGVNLQSTVWAIHAMAALGVESDARSIDWIDRAKASDGSMGDAWRTAEAIIPLSGARFPLPGFTPIVPPSPTTPAREGVVLRVSGPFTHATWTFEERTLHGPRVTFEPEAAGTYRYHLHAWGPGARAHTEGTVTATSARPILPAFPANVTLTRHTNLTLDLRNATDPDGRIIAFELDWGDGHTTTDPTTTPTHAYSTPGDRTIQFRAVDDQGVWSHPVRMQAIVLNRVPVLPELPARLTADRTQNVSVDITATDPDGDPVTLTWSLGELSGEGRPLFRPEMLGEHTLRLVARDGHGGQTLAETIVEVVNLPPRVAIDDPHTGRANATDADGPPPTLTWTVDGAPHTPPFELGPGRHLVHVAATDADGASATASTSILVAEPEAPATPTSPEITEFESILAEDVLRVTFAITPADAHVRIAWVSDAGLGESTGQPPVEIPLLGATWAEVTLTVESDGLEASRESGRVRAPSATVGAAQTHAPDSPPVIVEAPAAAAPVDRRDEQASALRAERAPPELEPASVKPMAPRQETPFPVATLLAGLLLATLGRRRARA